MPHGHTDGDAVVWFTKSNVVHMGDDLFNSRFPFVDRENGGSVRGLIVNIDKVIATIPDDARVIPGHGELTDKNGLRAFVAMLRGTSAAVEQGIAAGKSLDQIKADKVLAAWESWGAGFIKTDDWITTVYAELTEH
ncbi:MAG TPA: hypothetical protein VGD79_09450 [Thermoanaerobaculia bacterium]|jgi:glyoxylase-like metal-dependent hydrolase (beta-lactamase superfamily II)